MWRQSHSLTDMSSSSSSLGSYFIRVPRSVNRAVECFCNTLSRHIQHKTSTGVYSISTKNRYMCIPYTTLDSYTAFLEQRVSNNFPDILRNFVRMCQQWFPGRFSYCLGTRLLCTLRSHTPHEGCGYGYSIINGHSNQLLQFVMPLADVAVPMFFGKKH